MANDPSLGTATDDLARTPRHGFRGEARPAEPASIPAGLTIALSREAGSRGHTIGQRLGQKLGWPIYNQELLEYLAREGNREDVRQSLSPEAVAWADDRLDRLVREQRISPNPQLREMARVVLALGSQGEVILIGRGAGFLLPRATTLHVRIIAPRDDRVAYMSQWLRLTLDEAAEQVRLRDTRRAEYLAAHFHWEPHDMHCYDLILNSSLLGEEGCASLIAQAARAKMGEGDTEVVA